MVHRQSIRQTFPPHSMLTTMKSPVYGHSSNTSAGPAGTTGFVIPETNNHMNTKVNLVQHWILNGALAARMECCARPVPSAALCVYFHWFCSETKSRENGVWRLEAKQIEKKKSCKVSTTCRSDSCHLCSQNVQFSRDTLHSVIALIDLLNKFVNSKIKKQNFVKTWVSIF